jgi:hypothetical protein
MQTRPLAFPWSARAPLDEDLGMLPELSVKYAEMLALWREHAG